MSILNILSIILSVGTLSFIIYIGVTVVKENNREIAETREEILHISATTDDETLLIIHNMRVKDRVARKIISDEIKKRGLQ